MVDTIGKMMSAKSRGSIVEDFSYLNANTKKSNDASAFRKKDYNPILTIERDKIQKSIQNLTNKTKDI